MKDRGTRNWLNERRSTVVVVRFRDDLAKDEAAGGELEITARFPGNEVRITSQNEVIARKAS